MFVDTVIEQKYSRKKKLSADKMVWWWQKSGVRKKYKIDLATCQIIER
jgi:hypothetical protein